MRCSWLAALCCSLFVLLASAEARAASGNLLSGRTPSRQQGVGDARRLTDGVRAEDGADWGVETAVKFESTRSFVLYDLGKVTKIGAAYLQADNNDEYTIGVSTDGRSFEKLWVAPPVGKQGLRPRHARNLNGSGRYVRLSARGGDGAYAVTELALFETAPAVFPPKLRVQGSGAKAATVRDHLLAFVFAAALLLFVSSRRTPGTLLPLAVPALLVGFLLVKAMALAWPLGAREISMLRAAMAGIAGLALLRQVSLRKVFPAHPGAVVGALVLSAGVAFASFYNLGTPQFWNHKEDRPEFVHTWDMRVYYPFAKYYEELGYDGVYLASAAAYLEDVPGADLEKIGQHDVRNLDTLRLHKLGDLGPEIARVKERFSTERWQRFKHDMTYFREVMGRDYLRTLHDHGANATPVWVACARLLLGWAPASEAMLVFGGLVDAFLLLALFAAIWRTFGLKPMLVAMVVFGANDFYMFGTNWGGATLRHDWLAYLGFGVCALRAERFVLAGVFFGLSTMIRAFPVLALAGVVLPVLWWIWEQRRTSGKLPGLGAVLAEHRPAALVLGAALCSMVVLFAVTAVWFSPGAWTEWWRKIVQLNAGVGVNDVSLKALVMAGDEARPRTALYLASQLACVALVACACRYRRLEHAVLLCLPLIAVVGNPSSYYLHLVFLMPLLGSDERLTGQRVRDLTLAEAGLPLLAICVAQYWTALDPDANRHFQAAVALLFAGWAWLYANVLKKSLRAWPELKVAPARP